VAAAAHVHDEVQGGAGKKETFIIYASLSLAPHIQTLPIFCAYYLWPWLGPPTVMLSICYSLLFSVRIAEIRTIVKCECVC